MPSPAELVAALSRAYALNDVFPGGDPVSLDALGHLRGLLAGGTSVEVAPGGLRVDGIEVPDFHGRSGRLARDLRDLGVRRIDFLDGVTVPELEALVRTLRDDVVLGWGEGLRALRREPGGRIALEFGEEEPGAGSEGSAVLPESPVPVREDSSDPFPAADLEDRPAPDPSGAASGGPALAAGDGEPAAAAPGAGPGDRGPVAGAPVAIFDAPEPLSGRAGPEMLRGIAALFEGAGVPEPTAQMESAGEAESTESPGATQGAWPEEPAESVEGVEGVGSARQATVEPFEGVEPPEAVDPAQAPAVAPAPPEPPAPLPFIDWPEVEGPVRAGPPPSDPVEGPIAPEEEAATGLPGPDDEGGWSALETAFAAGLPEASEGPDPFPDEDIATGSDYLSEAELELPEGGELVHPLSFLDEVEEGSPDPSPDLGLDALSVPAPAPPPPATSGPEEPEAEAPEGWGDPLAEGDGADAEGWSAGAVDRRAPDAGEELPPDPGTAGGVHAPGVEEEFPRTGFSSSASEALPGAWEAFPLDRESDLQEGGSPLLEGFEESALAGGIGGPGTAWDGVPGEVPVETPAGRGGSLDLDDAFGELDVPERAPAGPVGFEAAENPPAAPAPPDLSGEPVDRLVEQFLAGGPHLRAVADELRARGGNTLRPGVLDAVTDGVLRLVEAGDRGVPGAAELAGELAGPGVTSRIAARLGHDRDPRIRQAMVRAAAGLGEPMARALADALSDDPERSARRAYLDALVALGPVGRAAVDAMLADSRWFVVRNGAAILGEVGGAGASGRLLPLLDHGDARVRREAVMALARLESTEAAAPVERMLGDPEPEVRAAAAVAAGALRLGRAVRTLHEMLESEKDPSVVEAVAGALGALGDPASIPLLERRAAPSFFSRTPTPIRIAAYRALHAIGTPRARALLEAARSDRDSEVREAVRSLQG